MVQSDLPRGRTQSGKVNVKWYLQRLKASANNRYHYLNNSIHLNQTNSNDTIRVVRGTTATQGKHFPRVLLTSPTRSFDHQTIKQKSSDHRRSSSIHISSATSIKSLSTVKKISPSISEFNSNSYQSIKTTINQKDEKDHSLERRNSSGTLLSTKPDLIAHPSSTPVDQRCQRIYSSTTNSIQRETCLLLGPQLCSDCIETQIRANLSPERLPNNLMQQRLSSLAVRRFVKNEENFSDDDLLKMVNNQEIEMTRKDSNELNCSVITDEEYFDRLSSSLDQYSGENQFYFKDLKDFALKSQSNNYQRLLLSETPSPKSSNPIFKESTFEKFDVSDKYSYMKLASTIKPNLKSNLTTFISPKKSEQFYNQHRYLINYSPPLLIQTLQQNVRNNSNKNINLTNTNYIQKRSLIDSKSSFKHSIQL